MGIKQIDQYIKLMESQNDPDAVMGLRGAQNLCKSEGVTLGQALQYAFQNIGAWKKAPEKTIDQAKPAAPKPASAPAVSSGVPECRAVGGQLELIAAGQTKGEVYALPGEAAKDVEAIAHNLKDAVVAAVINKSKFKLKLNDVKDAKGQVVETLLQAEYERNGMMPIQIWSNNRGEVGALASVLRKAVANTMPDLAA